MYSLSWQGIYRKCQPEGRRPFQRKQELKARSRAGLVSPLPYQASARGSKDGPHLELLRKSFPKIQHRTGGRECKPFQVCVVGVRSGLPMREAKGLTSQVTWIQWLMVTRDPGHVKAEVEMELGW